MLCNISMYLLFLRNLLRLRVALTVELKMKAVVTVIRWAMTFLMMMELMKESALKAIVQQKEFLKLAAKRYVLKKNVVLDLVRMEFIVFIAAHRVFCFGFVTEAVLIAQQGVNSCWTVLYSTKGFSPSHSVHVMRRVRGGQGAGRGT